MNSSGTCQSRELEDAFLVFSQASEQLATSYKVLEQRVAHLNDELAVARSERLSQLAEKERLAKRLQSLLEALPAGVVVLDGTGRVEQCNPAALDLLGEPLLGEVWLDVIARAFAPRSDDGHEISLRDGRLVSISTSSLGAETGQILLLKDVTETRALQEMLSRHKRLTAMGEMIASLAHQIRTPLASALLYTSQLARSELAPGDRQRFSSKVLSRMRHLENLVNDMLLFVRGGGVCKEDIPVARLMADLEQAAEAPLAAGACSLELDSELPDAVVRGNHDALLGAFLNLVTNAVEMCGPGGKLQFQVRQVGEETLDLRLSDDGPGIPEALQERIFEPFFTTRSQGTGLGLAVVQAVAQAHSGAAWVESQPGAGCTFGLRLPFVRRGEHAGSDAGHDQCPHQHAASVRATEFPLKQATDGFDLMLKKAGV